MITKKLYKWKIQINTKGMIKIEIFLIKIDLLKANKVKHIECFYCHKRGHKANQCLKKKNDDHKAQLVQVPEISKTEQCLCASNIQDEDNQDNSIITDVSLNINMEPPMEWYIDSGATLHMWDGVTSGKDVADCL
ncbi:uncharacterized protein LOC112213717 [Bombus impatiens]|uniref:Uncharacterized protein LOC112213717 n=1 Tax=Bombus impatiens TaxID=132113 RepID=A0A6P6FI85_BOMIM|nr:uncharacterized protein LOC112213717 [Bombus impatiens]